MYLVYKGGRKQEPHHEATDRGRRSWELAHCAHRCEVHTLTEKDGMSFLANHVEDLMASPLSVFLQSLQEESPLTQDI